MKRRVIWTVVTLLVIALGTAMAIAVPRLPERGSNTPTARVMKGALKLTVHATGELRAGRTMTLVAPPRRRHAAHRHARARPAERSSPATS